MKTAAYLLLLASLGANAFLASFLSKKEAAPLPSFASQKQTSTVGTPTASNRVSANTRLLWHRLGSNNLSQLVANLRAANLSPAKIAYIVHHILNEKYAALQDENTTGNEPQPYWRNSKIISENSYNNRHKLARSEALRAQRRTEEAQLLGDDLWLAEGIPYVDHIRQGYGNLLSNQKLSALRDLKNEYSAMATPLQDDFHDPATRQKLKLLEKEHRANTVKLLTPAELLEHDLRYGNAANLLQSRCYYFTATEAEYRTLFPIYQQIDQAASYSDWDRVDEKTETARKEAEKRAQAQIEAVLGPARYAEFKQANDPAARKENQLVTRLGLPLSAAAPASPPSEPRPSPASPPPSETLASPPTMNTRGAGSNQ